MKDGAWQVKTGERNFCLLHISDRLVTIGNIYQNPELLKGEKNEHT